jgi:hypothetical protein
MSGTMQFPGIRCEADTLLDNRWCGYRKVMLPTILRPLRLCNNHNDCWYKAGKGDFERQKVRKFPTASCEEDALCNNRSCSHITMVLLMVPRLLDCATTTTIVGTRLGIEVLCGRNYSDPHFVVVKKLCCATIVHSAAAKSCS